MSHPMAFPTTICALILAVAPGARAEEIINTLTGYDSNSAWAATGPNSAPLGGGKPYGDTDIAWRFRNNGTPHSLTTIELPLAEAFWLTGRIADISVWTGTEVPTFGHVPDVMLESVTINTVPIDRPVICTAVFSGATLLAPNTYYWVALSAPGTEQIRWYQDEFNLADQRGAWRKDLGVWQAPVPGAGYPGAMRVVGLPAALPAPVITEVFRVPGGLVLRGTNGPPLASYQVLQSTNLDSPLPQWTSVVTNVFDSGGAFNWTNVAPPASSQAYFRLLTLSGF